MIVEQRQIQCVVLDAGFKQLLVYQTYICLEPNREVRGDFFAAQKTFVSLTQQIPVCNLCGGVPVCDQLV